MAGPALTDDPEFIIVARMLLAGVALSGSALGTGSPELIAQRAVQIADALVKQLFPEKR